MKIDRRTYAGHYGPTTGDRLRLGDTGLVVEVESDRTVYGDEVKFGGGAALGAFTTACPEDAQRPSPGQFEDMVGRMVAAMKII